MLLPTASLLVLLSTLVIPSTTAEVIHLPLNPIPRRTDIHPQVLYQQHVNRAISRLANMKGLQGLSPKVARRKIDERIVKFGVGGSSGAGAMEQSGPLKREIEFRSEARVGMVTSGSPKTFDGTSVDIAGLRRMEGGSRVVRTRKNRKNGNKNKQGGAGGAAAAVAVTSDAAAASVVATAVAAAATGAGFSELDLAAALSGDVTPGNAPTADSSLAYDIEANDVGYLATIQIGTPPQDFLMLMDSGSSDSWIPSQACTQCGTHNSIGSSSSSSFEVSTQSFQVTYGSGSVAGMVVQDVMTIAGNTITQPFGVALQESVEFSASTVPFDGLVGLAQSILSDQGVPTPVEALATAGTIPAGIVSYDLGRVADGANTGQISFGAADATRVDAATLVDLPVVSTTGFWEAAVDDASVDGVALAFTVKSAILDSGTSLIIMPAADAAAIHAAIPGAASDGAGGFTLPCTTTTSVAFTFGGQSFAIDPRDLTFLPVDQNDLTGDCISGISSGNIGSADQWLVGDVFLKNVIFTTDIGANTVSLSGKVAAGTAAVAAATSTAAVAVATSTANSTESASTVALVSSSAAAVVASSLAIVSAVASASAVASSV